MMSLAGRKCAMYLSASTVYRQSSRGVQGCWGWGEWLVIHTISAFDGGLTTGTHGHTLTGTHGHTHRHTRTHSQAHTDTHSQAHTDTHSQAHTDTLTGTHRHTLTDTFLAWMRKYAKWQK